jgi:hypothetical protein
MRLEPKSESSDPDLSKIFQNMKCVSFQIQTWSGSANWTKSNVNGSGFGFPNLDSRTFMQRPQICIGFVSYCTDPLFWIQ